MLLFLRDSDECVPGLSTCLGRGAPLGSLLGSRGSVTGPLGARVRGLGVLPVRGVLARGSVGPRGRSLGALLVLGVLARVPVRPRVPFLRPGTSFVFAVVQHIVEFIVVAFDTFCYDVVCVICQISSTYTF